MKYDKYISTTLPYANSTPHIGHALEFVQADAFVKYFSHIKNESVFFNIGVDEYGLKVFNKAKELNINIIEYLNSLALEWKNFSDLFQIKYDNFYRTTNVEHKEKVQKFWLECLERGDLYKKAYKGKYCVGCESFKTEADLIDGKCTDHNTEPIITEEENWFFITDKYKEKLSNWLAENFLKPDNKLTELKNIIRNSEDISVSRLKKSVPWGIQVPNDETQVIYVWWEALCNYIFAVENFSEQNFIQICGPDNLRFQGFLFQAILESAGLPHTKTLLVHGTILGSDGKKMSKTIGNIIDPIEQVTKYGLDAVRYYLLAGLTTYGNGSWSEEDLIHLYNSDLADVYGNLIARVLHLIDIYGIEIQDQDPSRSIKEYIGSIVKCTKEHWNDFEIQSAIKETGVLLKYGNKIMNDEKPWERKNGYEQVLIDLYYVLSEAVELYFPVISLESYKKIKNALKSKKKEIIFKKINTKQLA